MRGGQHSTFCAMLYGRRNFASAVLVHNQRNSEMLLGGLASPVKFLHKKGGWVEVVLEDTGISVWP